jgi:K+-transporting ATPase KdpF subunit
VFTKLFSKEEIAMSFINGLSALIAAALFIYLVVVLFFPEKF